MTVDDVVYDPATHTSRAPDGREVPHVTAVLHAVGVTEDFVALAAVAPRVRENIATATARGSAVHADCHAFDDNDLAWATVDPRVEPYVLAWAVCRENLGLVPVAHGRERRIYHDVLHYTGILDGIFLDNRRGKTVLGDIKTGDPDAAAAHLQTAAYEAAWRRMHPEIQIDERWAIELRPGFAVPYRIVNYSARPMAYLDAPTFAACLTVYWAQPARRKLAERL